MSEFRTQFKNWGRVFRPHDPKEKSKTVQSAAQENDLNLIVDRLKKGLDPGVPIRESRYGLSVSPEMKEDSIMRVKDARSQFEALSPEERGDTKSFAEYLESKLTQEGGTVDSLDVTVPTDSKSVSSTQKKKGSSSETKTVKQSASQKSFKKGTKVHPKNNTPPPMRGGYRL